MNQFPNRHNLRPAGQGPYGHEAGSPATPAQAPVTDRLSENLPQNLPASEEEIAQREALAQLLLARGAAPQRIDHPLQGLAQLSNTALGALAQQQAKKQRRERRDVLAEFYSNLPAADRLTPEQKRMAVLLNPSYVSKFAQGEGER